MSLAVGCRCIVLAGFFLILYNSGSGGTGTEHSDWSLAVGVDILSVILLSKSAASSCWSCMLLSDADSRHYKPFWSGAEFEAVLDSQPDYSMKVRSMGRVFRNPSSPGCRRDTEEEI